MLIRPVVAFYTEKRGAGGRELGWLNAVDALAQTVCAPFWGALSDRLGRKPIISIGIIGYSISLFLFGLASAFWTLFIARSLSGRLSSATYVASLSSVGVSSSADDGSKKMSHLGSSMSVCVML
uniref:MFS transporter n=1 Tax=Clostridioides difficile TaxID=1496 RepID=UPI00117A3F0A